MSLYAVTTEAIQTTKSAFLGLKDAKAIEYSHHQILQFLVAKKTMLVFESLEDAKKYSRAKRDYTAMNTAIEANWAFKQPFIYEVELQESINLSDIKVEIEIEECYENSELEELGLTKVESGYQYPNYKIVPTKAIESVISAIDGTDNTHDMINPPAEKNCAIM
ncbi:MAG: hypothetical protein H0U71_09245 [Gammaproteobacteria bacterium]|nr:hypothetical protein [Gammaproteobacteria bacterium]